MIVCGADWNCTRRLESPQIAYSWYRLLRVIGHPSAIFDADVYLAAIVRARYPRIVSSSGKISHDHLLA